MINDTDAYPLKWPGHRPRTVQASRKNSAFKTTPGKARDELIRELNMLGAKDIIISTNIHTYEKGGRQVMYADQSASTSDPGVAVYYTWKAEQYCLSCDKWRSVKENLQAIMKTVNAIRGIERWGSGDMLKAAFAGFKELPDPAEKDWWKILGVEPWASLDEIRSAYKQKAKKHHPDVGGHSQAFIEIQEAYQTGLDRCGVKE